MILAYSHHGLLYCLKICTHFHTFLIFIFNSTFSTFYYFGAARYTNKATTANNIFGIHTANNGLIPPLVAKTVENCINNMYEKLINNPNPKWNPIPPRILREAIHTPINVNINVAKAPENILYFSI